MGFKIGDKVGIRKDSVYSQQIAETGGNNGVITGHDTGWGEDNCYEVIFSNEYTNSYYIIDLRLIRSSGKMKVVNRNGKLVFEQR